MFYNILKNNNNILNNNNKFSLVIHVFLILVMSDIDLNSFTVG